MNTMLFDRKSRDAEQFWKTELATATPDCAPRTDSLGTSSADTGADCISFTMGADICTPLKKIAQGPFLCATVLLAAYMIFLQKYNGRNQITVATPTRKPERSGQDRQVLVCQTITNDASFRDLLVALRKTLLTTYAHQDYALEHLIDDPHLFDVAFAFNDIHDPLIINDTALALECIDHGDTLQAKFHYDSTRYNPQTVALFARYYTHLLQTALCAPTTEIGALCLADPATVIEDTQGWNQTARPLPEQANVLHLIEDHAQSCPQTPVLVFEGTKINYEDALKQATGIACHLRARKIAQDARIGVCLQNPLQATLAFIGILKAGAAFLPLDPTYPDERLNYMITDCNCDLVIADQELPPRLPEASSHFVEFPDLLQDCDTPAPDGYADPSDLAYIIYTSGSTGQPKGVQLNHRGLFNLVRAQGRLFQITPHSRVLQFASLSFDAAISEIFVSLANGATLHLSTRARMTPVDPLLSLLQDQKITHVTVPPSLLAVLPATDLPDLETLIVAGEACPAELAQKWATGRRFLNGYGPTESTVCATVSTYNNHSKPLIGPPIDNTAVYILDENMSPVPVGVAGELYIDSVGLARGYLNRGELTAEKFVPNPFENGFSDRLYRSGDWARWQSCGEIEFLGRMDHQVKLRGFRIELEEITHTLCRHDSVENAVTLSVENETAGPQLVAFVTGLDANPDNLHCFLKSQLPDYMCPAHIMVVDCFPTLPNGKIDRHRLQSQARRNDDATHQLGLPRDNIELGLLHIWQDLLEVPGLGIHDDFFAKGGHSLLAVRLISRIEKTFKRKLELDLIFSHSSVEKFAALLRADANSLTDKSPLVPLRSAPHTQSALYCIHPAGGRTLCYIPFVQALDTDIPVYGLQAPGFQPDQTPITDLQDMARTYLDAMTSQQPDGPYHLLGWSGGAIIAFEMACQLQQQGQEVASLTLVDAYAPDALPAPLKNMDDAGLVNALLSDEMGDTRLDDLRALGPQELIAYIHTTLIDADIIPHDYTPDDVARFFDVYRANCRLAHSRLTQRFDGPLHLFRAEGEQALQKQYTPDDPTLGWQVHCAQDIHLNWVSGTHNSMMEPPHVGDFSTRLTSLLQQTRQRD